MEMEWVQRHNPDLQIMDDSGKVVQVVDLNGYTEERLEALLKKRGFKKL